MKKFKLFMDIQKEEDWLNSMAKKGWLCKHVSAWGIYDFEKTASVEQVIRIDYPTFRTRDAKKRYIELYEDYGWQHLGGNWLHYWLKPADGRDELFSDQASQKAYLRRLLEYYGSFGFVFLIIAFSVMGNGSYSKSLKGAYLTPGLWEKEGSDFLFAFLFETPFALMRFGMPWLLMIWGIAFMLVYSKYHKKAKELDKTT